MIPVARPGSYGNAPVMSAVYARTNGRLIRYIASLWLPDHLHVVDLTYGRGKWWTDYRPFAGVTGHDLRRDGFDYRQPFPYARGQVPIYVFDPPYVATGGDNTSTLPDFNDRYGLHTFTDRTPDATQAGINDGLANIAAALGPYRPARRKVTGRGPDRTVTEVPAEGGWALVKCMDYVSGGQLVPGEANTIAAADAVGLRVVDRILHVSDPRSQPGHNLDGTPRHQRTSRRNYSTLLVVAHRKALPCSAP